ncbi:pheromone-processing carboxypeptidase KEX1-like [Myzus persicae]|uniref:pheromone-processing carboxypeptidase KEX1-like n=1 Tax=Myzus persicae TaxID=13164 RepID=UPI000B9347C4|nr:pheromone-processing carboxypeptidase KEX1-like [Myzus persicae]
MDGRCVYLCLSVFIISFLSVTDGEKKILLIRDSLNIKPYDNRLGPKQLHMIVAKALTARYKDRKMLEVSKSRYNFHVAWRGIKNFFWKKVLGVFCPSIVRELKAVQVLKDLLIHPGNNSLKDKLGFKLPFKKSQKKIKEESSEEENDEESKSNEESDEKRGKDSDEESDEESDEKRNSKSKKGKKRKTENDSEEDDDDSDSDEDIKKKKANKSLDDLFK